MSNVVTSQSVMNELLGFSALNKATDCQRISFKEEREQTRNKIEIE